MLCRCSSYSLLGMLFKLVCFITVFRCISRSPAMNLWKGQGKLNDDMKLFQLFSSIGRLIIVNGKKICSRKISELFDCQECQEKVSSSVMLYICRMSLFLF